MAYDIGILSMSAFIVKGNSEIAFTKLSPGFLVCIIEMTLKSQLSTGK